MATHGFRFTNQQRDSTPLHPPPPFSVSALAALAAASVIRLSIHQALKQTAPASDPFTSETTTLP